MPDTVIDRFNILGKDQQDLFVFTGHRDQLIGDGDVELTWVHGDGDENEAPLIIWERKWYWLSRGWIGVSS